MARIVFEKNENGYTLMVPANMVLDQPIQITFTGTTNLQNKIIAEANSSFVVIEKITNCSASITTQITAKNNSKIKHYEIATHNANLVIKNEVKLLQEHACYTALGIALLDKTQQINYSTRVEHLVPNCTSNLLFKNVVDDSATATFSGRVVVYEKAIHSETHLTNKNLLLAPTATVNTAPELEIYADDIICTHGATVGQLDKEALFYLRTRGLDEKTARQLLLEGFIQEIINEYKYQEIFSDTHNQSSQ